MFRPLVAFASIVITWAAASGTGHAYCRLTTEMPQPGAACSGAGTPLSWQRQCLSFSLLNRVPAQLDIERVRDVADQSFRTWTDVECGRSFPLDVQQTAELAQCATPEYDTEGSNANTIIFVSDWSGAEFPRNAIGLTLVWHHPKTGEIYDADMQINETLGPITICGGVCAPEKVMDLQNVITHEAGHFLGLGHSEHSRATMFPNAPDAETAKRDLDADDEAGLCAIYGGLGDASCEASNFVPDRGFTSTCAPPKKKLDGGGLCAVTTPGSASQLQLGGIAWLVGLCVLWRLRPKSW